MGTAEALIFGAMPYESWRFLEDTRCRKPLVVCADGGQHCAEAAGFSMDLFIGDRDSGGNPDEKTECVLLPAEKDLTDFQAAFELAVERGCRMVTMTACTGGRQDHHMANLQLLETAFCRGIEARILDPWNDIRFCAPGTYRPDCAGYHYFSLIPVDRVLTGVTIENAKYPLKNHTVLRGDSLTVSNEPAGNVKVIVEQGDFYLILSN